ncbi:MAG: hypothetical protein NTW64_06270 [Candidatus Omnitrophica bacterium]|nr:hypothetical protein [Candidatus Omnitrophota bacterium]
MQFEELKKEIQDFGIKTIRKDENSYFEAVVVKDRLEQLTRRLEGIFGSPVWPSEKELSAKTSSIVENFGGIRDGQTLYLWREKDFYIFAILWPWSDGINITLKIGRE